VWDLAAGKEARAFRGHTSTVEALAFPADGKWLVSTGDDQTKRFWDVAAGKELCRCMTFRDGTWAAADAAGRFDAAGGGDVPGLLWVIANDPFPLGRFRDRFYDPGLLAKYLGFRRAPLRKVTGE
jgi:hypothetical protein